MRNRSAASFAVAVISGITALIIAGTPALAGTQVTKTLTGPEIAVGAVTGAAATSNNPTIPLTLTGVVNTTAPKFTLGSATVKKHTIPTKTGNLVVEQAGTPSVRQSANPKTCLESFTEDIQFTVVGLSSTGTFAGSSGPGAAQISFVAFAPRFTTGTHKGQCNFNATPLAKGAVATFLASIVLTIKEK